MTRVIYFDCFSGASGDMLLGALLDCGAPFEALRDALATLPVTGYELRASRVDRAGLAATKVDVALESGEQPHRHLSDVLAIIDGSALAAADKQRGTSVFRALADAEAVVHGCSVEEVEFHEVGAVDAIVDVLGVVVGLRLLGVERCYASALPAGSGVARTAHGEIPVPGPATLALLAAARAPLLEPRPGESFEMVTPTGAALLATLCAFERPALRVERIGYGAGGRNPVGRPNVLRAWLGESADLAGIGVRTMTLVETNIDDMSGEAVGWASERLFASGAVDVWYTAIQMKKNRPGVLLQVLCHPKDEADIVRALLRETSTLGVRVREVRRHEAARESLAFRSSLGEVTVKVKRLPDEAPVPAPEFEDCRRIALATGLPLLEVYRRVQQEADERLRRPER